jgi:hypothetical protein
MTAASPYSARNGGPPTSACSPTLWPAAALAPPEAADPAAPLPSKSMTARQDPA